MQTTIAKADWILMTDLLPHRDGQEDSITLEPGMAYISPEQVGHWYSPAAVARLIEEARCALVIRSLVKVKT